MVSKFTFRKFLSVLTGILLSCAPGFAAYTPVAVTGFNQDIVANGVGSASSSTTASADAVDYSLVAQDFQPLGTSPLPTYSLPSSGTINSVATSGLTFQLAAYSANNSLQIAAQNGSGTLTLTTPVAAGEIYLLGLTGSGAGTADVLVTFTDNTTESFTGIAFPDWYNGTGFAIQGIGRVNRVTDVLDGDASNPRLYQRMLSLNSANHNKQIASISITKTSTAGVLNIMAVTINDVCSGPVVGGTTLASTASVCPNSNFTLSLSGQTNGVGISYQWESSPAGLGVWTPIASATSATLTTNQTAATDYRAMITCVNGGQSDFSTPVTINMNPPTACYCNPTYSSGGGSDHITNVTLGTLNNSSTGNASPYYRDYTTQQPGIIAIPDLVQGITYNLSLTFSTDPNQYHGVWIDYDQDGVFSTSEFTSTNTNAGASGTVLVPLNIPLTAVPGNTRMRIRGGDDSQPQATQACGASSSNWGEAEDYLVNIVATTACSGLPNPGTASAPAMVCPSTNFNLTLSGYTLASGINIQWEESPAGANTWSPITGATSDLYTVAGGITNPMDYRAVVTCINGGLSDISNTVSITLSPFYNCYCIPTNAGSANITNVTLQGTTMNHTTGNAPAPTYYIAYPDTGSATASLVQGISYPVTLTFASTAIGSIWIDYNQNGIFESSEWIQTGLTGTSHSATLTIPLTAIPGQTGMRVRSRGAGNQNGAGDACLNMGGGETEDYVVTIVATVACSNMPTAGTISGPTGACPNTNYNLTLSGYTIGTGITIQWEESPAGANLWTPIPGATNAVYTITNQQAATDYRAIVTCTNGGQSDISNIHSVAQNPATACYCLPTYSSGGGNDYIANVQLGGLVHNTGASGNPAPYYRDYTSQQPGTLAIPDLAQGVNYTLAITYGPDGTQYEGVWIDFDQNGVFDASEYFTSGVNAGASGTNNVTLSIPVGATLGTTRMRIRGANDGAAPTSAQACGATNSNFGEAEDYLVNIIAAPSCLPPSGLTVTNIGVTSADVSWGSVAGAVDYEYAVTTSNTPPATGTQTSNTTEPVSGLSGSTTYYLHVRTNCGSLFSTWSTTSFQTLLANDEPEGAIMLTLGAGCTGSPYFNNGASHSTGEPYPNCESATGFRTVWYKFIAPASGMVKVSTDYPATMGDSKLAIFEATDSSDFSTFNIISCDDDNGVTVGTRSIAYAAQLTPGTTYYVVIDGYSGSSAQGNFCLTVDEVTASMLATAGTCANMQGVAGLNTGYTGWISLVTNTAATELVALVRQVSGSTTSYAGSYNINTGAVRQAPAGLHYLDRNYLITGPTSGSYDVRFFFKDSELTALQAVDPTATINNLNVTQQSGTTCQANFTAAGGTNAAVLQSATSSATGVHMLEVNVAGFSNFYIMAGTSPLTIRLGDISAVNINHRNRVDWTTLSEHVGDNFILERSVDGEQFTAIAQISARGTASNYSYWDESPNAGVNYYRLKLLDATGKFSYTKVVTAELKGKKSFTVEAYPNPVGNEALTIQLWGEKGSNPIVTISDLTGKTMKLIAITADKTEVSLAEMAAGVYLVKYSDSRRTETIKINKQ